MKRIAFNPRVRNIDYSEFYNFSRRDGLKIPFVVEKKTTVTQPLKNLLNNTADQYSRRDGYASPTLTVSVATSKPTPSYSRLSGIN